MNVGHLNYTFVLCVHVSNLTGVGHRYIHQRSQISYTIPCNDVVSHGAQFEGLRVFADHTHENKCRTIALTIFAHRAAFCACLSSRSDRRKNPKTPKFNPMPGSRWRMVWDLWCTSVASVLPNSTTRTRPDNHHGEDATFYVLPF